MPDFSDLERAARRQFGNGAVDEALRRVSESAGGVRHMVEVTGARFDRHVPNGGGLDARGDQASSDREHNEHSRQGQQGFLGWSSAQKSTKGAIPLEADPVSVSGVASDVGRVEPLPEQVPRHSHSAAIVASAVRGEYIYASLGLVLGLAAIIFGSVLCLNGVVGKTSWSASLFGLTSKINDAAPGVVLFIVGLFMIVATRPKIKLKDLVG